MADSDQQASRREVAAEEELERARAEPGTHDEQQAKERAVERMERAAPEGRPPPRMQRGPLILMAVAAASIGIIVFIVALLAIGGPRGAILGILALAGFFLLGAWPAFLAAGLRQHDDHEIREAVDHAEKSEHGRGPT